LIIETAGVAEIVVIGLIKDGALFFCQGGFAIKFPQLQGQFKNCLSSNVPAGALITAKYRHTNPLGTSIGLIYEPSIKQSALHVIVDVEKLIFGPGEPPLGEGK